MPSRQMNRVPDSEQAFQGFKECLGFLRPSVELATLVSELPIVITAYKMTNVSRS